MNTDHAAAPLRGIPRPVTFPLSLLIPILVVVSMATLGGLLLWQGWQTAHSALFMSARDGTYAMAQLIDEKIERQLAPTSTAIQFLTRSAIVDADTLDKRLERLPVLTSVLKNIQNLTALYVAYGNGDFFLVRQVPREGAAEKITVPPGAAYIVQSVTGSADGSRRGEWLFYGRNLNLISREVVPGYDFNPRERSWYKATQEDYEEHLTTPYIFFTTGQIGITRSKRSDVADVVVGFDADLSQVGEALKMSRLTPHSEIAIVGDDGLSYAYTDLSRTYRRENGQVVLASIKQLGVPALAKLVELEAGRQEAMSFDVDGTRWFGVMLPLNAFTDRNLNLIMATPDRDLLVNVREGMARQLWWTLGLALVLMFAGWLVGHRMGKGLADLARQAQRLTSFDFHSPVAVQSRIGEIRQLEMVLGEVCFTIRNFLTTTSTIGTEARLDAMLEKVLQQTVAATSCSRGAVYLIDSREKQFVLSAVADEAGPHAGPARDDELFPASLPLQAVVPGWDGGGPTTRGEGRLALPIMSRQQEPLGLLLLDHAQDASHVGEEFRAFVGKLS